MTLGLIYMRCGNTYELQRVIVSPRESEGVIHKGLRVWYSMTHKESKGCYKHNDDVEIIIEKTGVWPCEHEKKGQKRKRYARIVVTGCAPLDYKVRGVAVLKDATVGCTSFPSWENICEPHIE